MGCPHHKKLIFKGLQYFFINRKPEKYNTITPNSGRPLFMPIRLVQHYLWKRCFSWLKDQNVHFQHWAISKVSTDNSSMGSTLRMGENRLKLLHSYEPNKWQLDFYLQVYVKFVQNVVAFVRFVMPIIMYSA